MYSNLSDKELYQKCKEYGSNAREWLRKFAGLLPEVHRRELYKRKGYGSIHEFAAKLAGMSHKTVDRIIRLDKRLEDKPILREKLTSGAASWTKLEKVSYIATQETQKDWGEKVDNLSQPALEIYVKDIRKENGGKSVLQNTFLSENFSSENEFSEKTISFKINSGLELRFRLLKQKLEKEHKTFLTFQEVFEELMDSYEKKQEAMEKTRIKKVVQICPDCAKSKQLEKESQVRPTRYIPADIQKIIDDPDLIVALCKNHERIAHNSLIKNEGDVPANWQLLTEPDKTNPKYSIDSLVQRFRMGAT